MSEIDNKFNYEKKSFYSILKKKYEINPKLIFKSSKLINYMAIVKVKPVYNNIFVTITDIFGNVLLSKHAGNYKITGSKKKTPITGSIIFNNIVRKLMFLKKRNGFKRALLEFTYPLKTPIIRSMVYDVVKKRSLGWTPPWMTKNDLKKQKLSWLKRHPTIPFKPNKSKYGNNIKIFFIKNKKVKSHNGLRLKKPRRI